MNHKRIRQYLTSSTIAAAVFLAGVFSQDLLQKKTTAEFFGTLSDCFLFPAVLLGGVGAMTWVSALGNFDMLSYGFYFMFHTLFHPLTPHETYYEYKVRRNENQDGWLKHWLITGLVCLGASIVCLLFYMGESKSL